MLRGATRLGPMTSPTTLEGTSSGPPNHRLTMTNNRHKGLQQRSPVAVQMHLTMDSHNARTLHAMGVRRNAPNHVLVAEPPRAHNDATSTGAPTNLWSTPSPNSHDDDKPKAACHNRLHSANSPRQNPHRAMSMRRPLAVIDAPAMSEGNPCREQERFDNITDGRSKSVPCKVISPVAMPSAAELSKCPQPRLRIQTTTTRKHTMCTTTTPNLMPMPRCTS